MCQQRHILIAMTTLDAAPETTPMTRAAMRLNHLRATVDAAVAAGASRASLCRAAEPPVHPSQLTRWLSGQHEPRAEQVERIERAAARLAAEKENHGDVA